MFTVSIYLYLFICVTFVY